MTPKLWMASAALGAAVVLGGCSTAPKEKDRAAFTESAQGALSWFKANVGGLDAQLGASGGYVVFPDVAQWGIILTGGTTGRGAVYDAGGRQIGWAALGSGSLGLQAGVQGFKMLMVFQDAGVLSRFKNNQWTGSAMATAVAGDAGTKGTAPFREGVAIYTGDPRGLMAGVNVALENIRYLALEDAPID